MSLELIPLEEQKIRKKAEEKEDKVPAEKKPEDIISVLPRHPIIEREEKERRGGVPVIPDDPCCSKLCKILNDKIDFERKLLNISVSVGGGKGLSESRTYRSLISGIEGLEDHRHNLKDKGGCRCIEETGAVSIILPLIQVQEKKEERAGYAPFRGQKLQSRPPERVREIYREEKSIIPDTNACCPDACKILNKEIANGDKILDNMELRGGPSVYYNKRYEDLSYRTFALQKFRSDLKIEKSCKCSE